MGSDHFINFALHLRSLKGQCGGDIPIFFFFNFQSLYRGISLIHEWLLDYQVNDIKVKFEGKTTSPPSQPEKKPLLLILCGTRGNKLKNIDSTSTFSS